MPQECRFSRFALMPVLGLALMLQASAARPVDLGLPDSYPARVIDVIDGDSLRVQLQIWIGQTLEVVVRLEGIDTPELRGRCEAERIAARGARDRLAELIGAPDFATPLRLMDIRRDKFAGRVIARVLLPDGRDLAAMLLAEGLGSPYGGGRRSAARWCGGDSAGAGGGGRAASRLGGDARGFARR